MQWIGERFFADDGKWIDAATAHPVRMHFSRPNDPIDRNDRCARLSTLRHPLLNALLDYGAAPARQWFEAYESGVPVAVQGSSGEASLEHAIRFLKAQGVALDTSRARIAVRAVAHGRGRLARPVGVALQPRATLRALEDALDGTPGAGPHVVLITGANLSGLRTLRLLAARAARVRGFIPLSPATLERYPHVLSFVRDRHVCLFDDMDAPDGARAASATVIAELAAASTRRHVIVRFARRTGDRGEPLPALVLEPMATRALVGMVYADAAEGPSPEELFNAARAADGRPGLFLRTLTGDFDVPERPMTVHETAAQYVVDDIPLVSPTGSGRVLGAALRAIPRAVAMARSGRHAAAARALERALRVLIGRERPHQAADCTLQLGSLALDRGRIEDAQRWFTTGRELAAGRPVGIMCTVGHGVALTDAGELLQAEAVLRGAVASAQTIDGGALDVAVAALARCLAWQRRHEEAAALVTTRLDHCSDIAARCRLQAVLARAQCRLGRTAIAVATAREAQRSVPRIDDPRVVASVELALAEALRDAGDLEGMRAAATRARRVAKQAHLPLFRVRAVILTMSTDPAQSRAGALRECRRLALPKLLAERLEEAATIAHKPPRVEAAAELEAMLDISQRSGDDRAALAAICRAVGERLRTASVAVFTRDDRTLTIEGRAFGAVTSAIQEVLACGTRVVPDGLKQPSEAAEPIRYGGDVIGVLACRWTAGISAELETVSQVLRAAALSSAAPVRALLDLALPEPPAAWSDLIGESAGATALRDAVGRAARAPFPVLIEGESGCGKEVVARAVHRLGPRRDRKFCAVNCAALSDDLLEAELFGHTRGAFTGAAAERAGLFEEADGGTIFLDEVGELSARAQAKLLRVLQEGEVRRVGENLPRRVDVRVVAATNRRLEEEVSAGRFRADLRFRLDVVRIPVPPLRDRATDIPILAAHFWRDASARVGSHATLSGEALAALARYDWPGNVRELQNVIAWMAVHSPRRGRVGPSAVPRHVAQAATPLASTLEAAREEFERRFIRAALAGANGQRARAADSLGISRQGLSKMMRRLRIEAP